MSPRLALWVLWTALTLCLPAAARLELCLCDGPRGLLDGAACGMDEEAQACCCAPAQDGAPRLGASSEERGCQCVTLDVQRLEPKLHGAIVPATPLRADATQAPVSIAPALRAPCFAPRARTRERPRISDGLPLRI